MIKEENQTLPIRQKLFIKEVARETERGRPSPAAGAGVRLTSLFNCQHSSSFSFHCSLALSLLHQPTPSSMRYPIPVQEASNPLYGEYERHSRFGRRRRGKLQRGKCALWRLARKLHAADVSIIAHTPPGSVYSAPSQGAGHHRKGDMSQSTLHISHIAYRLTAAIGMPRTAVARFAVTKYALSTGCRTRSRSFTRRRPHRLKSIRLHLDIAGTMQTHAQALLPPRAAPA
ncbi:hypothetical protein EVAR_51595_1 [Eumeta japonica]|uniref:Uncharacterized protein n=1 Tax=Eumeta variegata TaxID=151549 RepID=A0A4C1YF37_EUMVA|nr:hypothetical protein EVAR_51595_1 [Eumeta japonica]